MQEQFHKPSFIFTREYAKSLFYSRVEDDWTDYPEIIEGVFSEDDRYFKFIKQRTHTFFELLAEMVGERKIIVKNNGDYPLIKRFGSDSDGGNGGFDNSPNPELSKILKFQRSKVTV